MPADSPDSLGRYYRIPEVGVAVHRITAGQPRERHALTVEQRARILRCSLAMVYSLPYYGHLAASRTAGRATTGYRSPSSSS